jgi:hypothetical protein
MTEAEIRTYGQEGQQIGTVAEAHTGSVGASMRVRL